MQVTDRVICALLNLSHPHPNHTPTTHPTHAAADAHFVYKHQDIRMRYKTRTHTAAHRYYTYNQYTGNSSYLQMQQSKYYQKTTGSNKYGWCAHLAFLW